MPDALEKWNEQLTEAQIEREEILERLMAMAAELELELPSLSPLTPQPTESTGFDERSTPVAVLSLQGLRQVESIVTELKQRRDAAAEREQGTNA